MKERNFREENLAQAEAFRRLHNNEQDLITLFAADFLKVINDFERYNDERIPMADDLLWIESELRKQDITEGER
jgi:hypothetical protein